MEPSAMNDEFLRHLRPRPRAAFVHELKAKLDRLPRTRPLISGPAYLRTLLVALLIGGAAFAVTMMSSRHEPIGVRGGAAGAQAGKSLSGEVADDVSPVAAARSPEKELTPAIIHAARRDSAPPVVQVASASPEPATDKVAAASSSPIVAESPAYQVVAGIAVAVAGEGVRWVEGGGGEFPSPVYNAWGRQYQRIAGLSVSYEVMGSGGGLKLLQNRSITFAARDFPVETAELKASGLFQFPMLVGAVVPIVHLAGVRPSQIVLDGPTLAGIYLGEITRWNDAPILKLNPGLALPSTRITLAYRMDGSASTRTLTEYLSKSNNWFKGRYGVRTQIDVSPGAAVRGDNGMVDLVERTDGAIGYVEYLYAKQHGVESIRLINKDGRVVPATPESLQSAVMHADWSGTPDFGASLIDLPGEKTWPMTAASYVVMQLQVNRPQTAAAVQFFNWAYRNGAETAAELGYGTIPPAVADQVRASWTATLGKGAAVPPAGK
jgi:phosphate transport system substrate-binding protein